MCNKMSDVRLSNASPTVERVDARQPDNVRPPVRRNLFGSPDPEEIRRHVAAVIQENVRDFRDQYDFDPVEERPLTPRNYEWQQDGDAAEFYHRPPHRRERDQREVDSSGESNQEGRSDRLQDSSGSRKRRSGDAVPGSCSSECQSKRSHTSDDDEDESDGAASQAVKAAEKRRNRPEHSAEVQ